MLDEDDLAESPAARASVGPLPNVLPPLQLDVCAPAWPVSGNFDAITCANMIHASPPQTLPGLMQGAAGVGLSMLRLDGALRNRKPVIVLPDAPF